MAVRVVKNPRKAFNFLVEIKGLSFMPVFGAQSVTLPDSEIEDVEHGFGNTVLHTGGLVKPGTIKISRIISLGADSIANKESEGFYLWQQLVQDGKAQSGGDPDDYKFTVVFKEIAPSGFGVTGAEEPVVISVFSAVGCWPQMVNGREYKLGQSENLVENVDLKVDYFFPGHDTP